MQVFNITMNAITRCSINYILGNILYFYFILTKTRRYIFVSFLLRGARSENILSQLFVFLRLSYLSWSL